VYNRERKRGREEEINNKRDSLDSREQYFFFYFFLDLSDFIYLFICM